jgi:hypothetical protein
MKTPFVTDLADLPAYGACAVPIEGEGRYDHNIDFLASQVAELTREVEALTRKVAALSKGKRDAVPAQTKKRPGKGSNGRRKKTSSAKSR